MQKSTLSRRLSLLEASLDVRLVQRSSRHFRVTDIGHEYFKHCLVVLEDAELANAAIERARFDPRGTISLTCPTELLSLAR
jgi:DNA-binding transcriptional LysR family regulator